MCNVLPIDGVNWITPGGMDPAAFCEEAGGNKGEKLGRGCSFLEMGHEAIDRLCRQAEVCTGA